MKTKEELNALKDELASLNKKLAELNEDELAEVAAGIEISGPTKELSFELPGYMRPAPGPLYADFPPKK